VEKNSPQRREPIIRQRFTLSDHTSCLGRWGHYHPQDPGEIWNPHFDRCSFDLHRPLYTILQHSFAYRHSYAFNPSQSLYLPSALNPKVDPCFHNGIALFSSLIIVLLGNVFPRLWIGTFPGGIVVTGQVPRRNRLHATLIHYDLNSRMPPQPPMQSK
jgi:hypothetical protein